MSKQEQLKKLIANKNPTNSALSDLATMFLSKMGSEMDKVKGDKGEAGYTPIKGQDYFTEKEINLMVEYVQSKVKNGESGPQGPEGKPGKNGETPIRGIDYWTTTDQARILKDVLAKIPRAKDGINPDITDVVNKAVTELQKKPIQFKDIKGTEDLMAFLKLGGFRGGGGSGGGTTSPLTTKGDLYTFSTVNARLGVGADGTVLTADSTQPTGLKWAAVSGTGTVTTVSVATANGISGSVANATTTPAITLTLGAITPTSVNGITLSGSGSMANSGTSSLTGFTGSGTSSGTNTGDQTITLTGHVTGSGTGSFATSSASKFILQGTTDSTVSAAQFLGALATGLVKNTTTTGVLSIATAGTDYQVPISLTTSGTSGVATFISNTLNIPNYTYTLPTATTSVLGGVKVDGTSITISGGVISATSSGGGTVTSVASADSSITVTNPTTTVDLAVVKAPKWTTARNLAGNSVDGSANVAFANKFIVQGTTDTGLSGAQFLGALTTGILKNTTTTGVLTIAIAADFPTLNQNTSGTAATATALATGRTIGILTGDATSSGSSFDGTANNTNALTLATVNANVGSFTNANITVNAKGLITAASNGTAGSGSVTSVSVTSANGVSGSVATATTTPAITLAVTATTKAVAQSAHGFTVGQVLKFTGGAYALAKADSAADAEVVGAVYSVVDANNFVLITGGYLPGLTSLTANTTYFLDPSTAGALTSTAPSTVGQVVLPLLVADSTTTGFFQKYRGELLTSPVTTPYGVATGGTGVATFTAGIVTSPGGTTALTTVAAPTGTVVGTSDTQNLTNKRVTRRVVTTTQSATPAINTDNTDVSNITGLAQAITSFTTNLTGTPGNGDLLEIRITDNGTARAITWGASFVATTVALPTTTVISTMLRVGFEWNSTTSKWECIAVA